MNLFNLAKDVYNSYKHVANNEVDLTCPRCGETKLQIVDGLKGKIAFCPNCHYNYEDNNESGSSSPSFGMLLS